MKSRHGDKTSIIHSTHEFHESAFLRFLKVIASAPLLISSNFGFETREPGTFAQVMSRISLVSPLVRLLICGEPSSKICIQRRGNYRIQEKDEIGKQESKTSSRSARSRLSRALYQFAVLLQYLHESDSFACFEKHNLC